ncbi:MAG TPA: TfoX/Sxy family protein [Thermohalobaculum sp.]|nr:TfoX/Sxy family protein [Thermohalobaculum sp.]
MALGEEFSAHLCDLFGALGPLRIRRMFGGAGLFIDDAMFGLVADEIIYMKTDDELAGHYAEAGSRPFTYSGSGKSVEMSFWRLPDSALDDPDEALDWARRSLVPAQQAAMAKRAAKARKAARAGGA